MRRRALLAACMFGGGAVTFPARSQTEHTMAANPQMLDLMRDFVGPADDPDFGGAQGGSTAVGQVGTGSARHIEVAKAMRLMFDAPLEVVRRQMKGEKIIVKSGRKAADGTFPTVDTGMVFDPTNPISYAAYFSQITEVNDEKERYKAEWNSSRSNPLIVGFFGMTNSLPSSGDQTAWCTAFVNFCLHAAGKQGTFSALSGSFREHGEDAYDNGGPVLGDVVVFKKIGEDGNKGFGHVGFFVAEEGDSIWVLGGNQRADLPETNKPSKGEVTLTKFPRTSESLMWASNRRIPEMKL